MPAKSYARYLGLRKQIQSWDCDQSKWNVPFCRMLNFNIKNSREFQHVSVSEQQRSQLYGQNLCGAFVRLYWQPTSKSDQAMAADGTTKMLVSPPPK